MPKPPTKKLNFDSCAKKLQKNQVLNIPLKNLFYLIL